MQHSPTERSLDYVDATKCLGVFCFNDELDQLIIELTASRSMLRNIADIKHIDDAQSLIIELEFNEPIKQITMLRIGEFNGSGGCVSSINGCVDITPAAPIGGVPPAGVVFGDLDDVNDRSNDKIWNITVPKSNLNGLNGKLVLTVKAMDKNNHRLTINETMSRLLLRISEPNVYL